jgi:exocyst complex component 5
MATLARSGSELIASAKDAYLERLDSSELTPGQKAMLLRLAGLKNADQKHNEIEVTEQDGVLSVANAKRMLKWLAEGVGRGLELSGGNETPKDVSALLNLLLANMGEIYIETALDAYVSPNHDFWKLRCTVLIIPQRLRRSRNSRKQQD